MSGDEYANWVRYYNTEPFGSPRREHMHGDLMASLWALHGGPKTPSHMRSAQYWRYGSDDPDDELNESAVRAKLGV